MYAVYERFRGKILKTVCLGIHRGTAELRKLPVGSRLGIHLQLRTRTRVTCTVRSTQPSSTLFLRNGSIARKVYVPAYSKVFMRGYRDQEHTVSTRVDDTFILAYVFTRTHTESLSRYIIRTLVGK